MSQYLSGESEGYMISRWSSIFGVFLVACYRVSWRFWEGVFKVAVEVIRVFKVVVVV